MIVGDKPGEDSHVPARDEVARLRAVIARDQAAHWRRLLWEPAFTKKEVDRRESLWIWWGNTAWATRLALRGEAVSRDKGFAREAR